MGSEEPEGHQKGGASPAPTEEGVSRCRMRLTVLGYHKKWSKTRVEKG